MAQSQKPQGPAGCVLVVDDDPAAQALLAAILEPQGFEVQTVSNGPAALAAFHMTHFDVILTDFQMPGMSGLELVAEMRKTDPMIPIALITGMADALAAEAVVQAGIDRIFAKPFKTKDLLHWVNTFFSRRADHAGLGLRGLASPVA
jgi:CheY-like chemotaxis protein